ncbi:MAG TPA: hypothetical protein VFF78_02110 [Anaerolineaceae bacterium]|nr:hypothetical protein [Anaerolineaceae bacterium]
MFERQFGQFLVMVGSVIMILFVLSYVANQINFWLFLSGVAILYFGFRILTNFPAEPRPKAERFRMVKKLGSRKKKEKKEDKKEKKEEKSKE